MNFIRTARTAATVVGLVLLLAFVLLTAQAVVFIASSTATDGTVIEMVALSTSDAEFAPRIEFTDTSGTRVVFKGEADSVPLEYAPGDKVPIRYLPSDPQGARMNTFSIVSMPLITWMLSVAFTAVGFVPLWVVNKMRP